MDILLKLPRDLAELTLKFYNPRTPTAQLVRNDIDFTKDFVFRQMSHNFSVGNFESSLEVRRFLSLIYLVSYYGRYRVRGFNFSHLFERTMMAIREEYIDDALVKVLERDVFGPG